MRVARRRVDFVPPAQADEAPAGDVFEVVEVGGQEQDGDDEDEDEVGGEEKTEEVDEEGGDAEGQEGYLDMVGGRLGDVR